MKFVQRDLGAAAEASSGGGRRGLRREIVVVLGATAALVLGLYLTVGLLVEWWLPRISVERERAWFGSLELSGVLARSTMERDARHRRARRILDRLAKGPDVPAIDYRLVVLDQQAPNAFAFPGGTIGVSSGLLDLLHADEEEVALAFVLAHELGHFAQRDHLRGIGRQLGRALVWAVVFKNGGGELLSRNVPLLLDLRHSRASESGADRFGVKLVFATYGTTDGTDRLFAWFEQRERLPAWTVMLATHPGHTGRLRALREYAASLATESAASPAPE